MAASSAVSNHPFHVRSISLPSESHPLSARVEEQILCLRSTCCAPSTTNVTPQQICEGLMVLGDLFDCIEELLCLSCNQQALGKNLVEAGLEESVRLLDLCDTLRSILVSTKEHILDTQSSIRRNNAAFGSTLQAYLHSRKKVDKDMSTCLATLKQMGTKRRSNPASQKVCGLFGIDNLLMEATDATFSLLQSISTFLSMQKPSSQRWSFISSALQKKKLADQNDMGVGSLALTLYTSYDGISNKNVDRGRIHKLQFQLETLESSIKDLETGLECLFRRLIRKRVSLLNILSH